MASFILSVMCTRVCVPLRCEDGLVTGKESRSGRRALDRGRSGVWSPPAQIALCNVFPVLSKGLAWGWWHRFFPSPTPLIHFSLPPPTLNIGGDSKNSLMWQNRKKYFPLTLRTGPRFPFIQPAEKTSSK